MTWGQFKRQFEAEGREKADGYSPREFEGMSDVERAEARQLLLDRALAGDDIDLSGLRHVGDAGTVAALAAFDDAGRRFGWRFDIIRREVLFELTGEVDHLIQLTVYLDGSDGKAQERAGYAFTWYVLPPAAEPFFVERIVDGRHEEAILPLLKAWIGIQQRAVCDTMCFQRHLQWVRQVADARPGKRSPLLEAWRAEGFDREASEQT